jgi:translocation protein SEC62
MRKGVWYLSTSLLVFVATFFTIAIVRLIIYLITLATMSRQFWLFPNLFADCGVLESFKPLYGWEDPAKPKKGKKSKKNLETQPVKTETETTTAATTPVNKTTTTSTKPADTAAKKRIPTVEDVEE